MDNVELPENSPQGVSEEKENGDKIDAERLTQLTNSCRETIIREHRQMIHGLKENLSQPGFRKNYTLRLHLKTSANRNAEFKPITFRGMEPFKDHVYVGFELKCIIIEEPTLGYTGVVTIVEDENGDAHLFSVYGIEQNEEIHNKIGFGCQITILNPYHRIAMDLRQVIRVDDLENLIFVAGPDLSRCRYCGKSGAVKKCARCRKACYCSRECQERDWKVLKHKFVCNKV